MKYAVYLILLVSLFSACKKDPNKKMNEAREKFAGTYDILNVTVITYDTSGKILSSRTYSNPGTMVFTLNSMGINNNNWVDFPAFLMDSTVSFGKFKNAKFFYWDTDPEKKRFVIWGQDVNEHTVHTTFTQTVTQGVSLLYTESNNSPAKSGTTLARSEHFSLQKR